MVFSIFYYTLMTLLIIVSLFLVLLVLIQKGRGGGLATAFGGGGGNTAFGSKTGDVLTWATSIVFGVFLFLAIVLNLMANTHSAARTSALREETLPLDMPQDNNPTTRPGTDLLDNTPVPVPTTQR